MKKEVNYKILALVGVVLLAFTYVHTSSVLIAGLKAASGLLGLLFVIFGLLGWARQSKRKKVDDQNPKS